ncbi:MAG: hypothetical protein OSB58_02975 [Alphaproteobacteria bacterium]|nr:hypothetical protein [Alphaproteobacteria bacterium]
MFFSTRNDQRPYHLGKYPLETLPHDDRVIAVEAARPPSLHLDITAPQRALWPALYEDIWIYLSKTP